MEHLQQLGENKLFICVFISWLLAQLIKTVIDLVINRKLSLERLVGSGGMPSSHSSSVVSLATGAGIQYGLNSFEFTIAIVFALIVMYDAKGVRHETGKQAVIIKEIREMIDMFKDTSNMSNTDNLKELVGHTPAQVMVGALLGVVVTLVLWGI